MRKKMILLGGVLCAMNTISFGADQHTTAAAQPQKATSAITKSTVRHHARSMKTSSKPVAKAASSFPMDFDVPGKSLVSTGPYLGIPLQFSGSNLIINSPSINLDLSLLSTRKTISERQAELGRPADTDGAHVLLSGMIQGQASATRNNGGSSNVTLTDSTLDAYILGPSHWTSGLIELSYDNNNSVTSNNPTKNSRVFINKGFIVIGDLLQSPVYASIGQMYVPFGVYSTTLVSSPMTKTLGRTQARAIAVGYHPQETNALYATTYAFNGGTYTTSSQNKVDNGGLNAGYHFQVGSLHANLGGGVIANIADSQSMQSTGNSSPQFGGFGAITSSEQLQHRVAGYNTHVSLAVGDSWDFIAEYVQAARRFDPTDLTIDTQGAKPSAFNIEGVYTIPYFEKPTSVTLAYGQSHSALALGLPAQRYSFVVNHSYWKSTMESIELRRDYNYANNATSSGSSVAGPGGIGGSFDAITLQFAYFF